MNAIRKAGAGSLFAPTKAMNRVRAIAADGTQSSLTGGCFELRIVRICTEFCDSEGEPDGRAQPRRAASEDARPASIASRPADSKCASVKTASRIYCFAQRGVHATVKEVLTRAIAASNHWRIIRNGPRSTFDSNIGRIRATTPGHSRVMDDACGSASRVQRPRRIAASTARNLGERIDDLPSYQQSSSSLRHGLRGNGAFHKPRPCPCVGGPADVHRRRHAAVRP